ncbi:hypothetical protein Tco_0982746 [Tanacetum coccineum]
MGLPSTVFDEGTVDTMPLPEGLRGNKDSEGLKPPADMEPLTTPVADPSRTNAEITKDQWAQHEEAAVSYADLRASIKGYYEENVDHKDQTDKLFQETMDCLDKNSTDRSNLLKALNGVTKTLKVIQDVVKEDLSLKKKVLEATEAYTTNSNNITELISLAKTFDFSGLKSLVETMKAALDAQNVYLETWAKSSTSMAWNVGLPATEEPPSHTKRETDDIEIQETEEDKVEKEQESEESTKAVLISPFRPLMRTNLEVEMMTSPSTIKLTNTVLEILTPNSGAEIELIDPQDPIPLKLQHLKLNQSPPSSAYPSLKDQIKKAAKEAKMFAMTKTEVIKVVRKEAEKIGLDPKIIVSAKEGRKRKHMELEPKIRVPGLECNQSLTEGVLFVNNMVIIEPEYEMFFTDVFVMDSMIKTLENVRFYLKLKKLIAEHPDQEKLQSKKVKLKSVSHSVSFLQDAQSESTRKTLAFSEVILNE